MGCVAAAGVPAPWVFGPITPGAGCDHEGGVLAAGVYFNVDSWLVRNKVNLSCANGHFCPIVVMLWPVRQFSDWVGEGAVVPRPRVRLVAATSARRRGAAEDLWFGPPSAWAGVALENKGVLEGSESVAQHRSRIAEPEASTSRHKPPWTPSVMVAQAPGMVCSLGTKAQLRPAVLSR